jgi:DNA-binding FadR family transcriptional regulator
MAHCDDNQSQAAALLGISRHTLRTQLANLGLIKSRRRPPAPPRAFASAPGPIANCALATSASAASGS